SFAPSRATGSRSISSAFAPWRRSPSRASRPPRRPSRHPARASTAAAAAGSTKRTRTSARATNGATLNSAIRAEARRNDYRDQLLERHHPVDDGGAARQHRDVAGRRLGEERVVANGHTTAQDSRQPA